MNLYAYAGGDPVQYSDPWGLCAAPPDSILITVQVWCGNPQDPKETGVRQVWARLASADGIASLISMSQRLTGGDATYKPENVKTDYINLGANVYTFPTKSDDGLLVKDLALGHWGPGTIAAWTFRADVWGGIQAGKSGAVFGGNSVCTIVGHEGVHMQQSQGVGVKPGMTNQDYEDIAYQVPWSCK